MPSRAKTFPRFNDLPTEIRLRIWTLALIRLSPKALDGMGLAYDSTCQYKIEPFFDNHGGRVVSRRTETILFVKKKVLRSFMYPDSPMSVFLWLCRESRLATLTLWRTRAAKSVYDHVWVAPQDYVDLIHNRFNVGKAELVKVLDELIAEVNGGWYIGDRVEDPAKVYPEEWARDFWDMVSKEESTASTGLRPVVYSEASLRLLLDYAQPTSTLQIASR